MAEYVQPGYVTPGYFVPGGAEPPPPEQPEGTFDIDVGTPGNARHRTSFASVKALQLAYWQPSSPFSPYDVQPLFILHNHYGKYCFSTRGVPDNILEQVDSFETLLSDPEGLAFRSVPLGTNIIGTVSSIQRPTGRVTIKDPAGVWAKKLSKEAIAQQPGGLFWMVRRLFSVPALTGTIGIYDYTNRALVLEYGDFRRRLEAKPVIFSV